MELNEIDTSVFGKVDELLADTGKIPTQTAFRLTLALQRETAEAVNKLVQHVKEQNGRISKLESANTELQQRNIITWILGNPKTSVVYFFAFVLLLDVIVDKFQSADSLYILGALIKKALGL